VRTLYFDTNYLYRIYSSEPGHDAVKSLLADAGQVVTALHGRAEFAAVLLRKRRENADPAQFLQSLEAQFHEDHQSGLIDFLPLGERVMQRLENTLRTFPVAVPLRAADALHLACAAENGFAEIYSNDRHLLAAAPLFGLNGINVI
jgi:predicted nucleic acid-binding protein